MINKQSELILSLSSRLDQQNEYIDKQVEVKLNEAIEKTKEIESLEFEQSKEIEAPPKEIQMLKYSKLYPLKKVRKLKELLLKTFLLKKLTKHKKKSFKKK